MRQEKFRCSLRTGKYYAASVVFDDNHANVRSESGTKLDLALDRQCVDELDYVVATDPRKRWCAPSSDDFDEPSRDCLAETPAVPERG